MQSAFQEALGYDESPSFLRAGDLEARPFSGFSHVYRKAREECGLEGVYLLDDPRERHAAEVPVVFYCKADNEAAARRIHLQVWNQGVVPFVLVETPGALRLYSGFRCDPRAADDPERGVLEAAVSFNEVADRLAAFRAEAIDSGAIWDRWGQHVDPAKRVNPSLLDELEKLGKELRRDLEPDQAHALIGKFVYLKYLRDREILSDRKMARWGLEAASVFGPRATLRAFHEVDARLGDWLNGAVFPLRPGAIRTEHLQLVASVFAGGTSKGQLPLDLGIYEFSFIPIETLSIIYEQFLHASKDGGTTKGRRQGAYYTPIPLVNYMLAELESRRPLEEGMRVLDPACGSGAFLVQCYRALIEKKLSGGQLRPAELRSLLTQHIFGVDRDEDACRVAEMSLILTLLDYTTPPDLESNPQFKLPVLRENNIFHADFFDSDSQWTGKRRHLEVDWLVGNPPWREVGQGQEEDRIALEWMETHSERFPTGDNQVAEAFLWHSLPMLRRDGAAALLLPAMTLFKMESTRFRARLFETVRAWSVTNFANLAYVLLGGRSQAPAAALFFEPREERAPVSREESILTFAPFLASQRAGRAKRARRKREAWSVVVNGAELRELRTSAVLGGDFRPWKEAMWGSFRDTSLLARIARRFPSLKDWAKAEGLLVHEGFQLRKESDGTDSLPELVGKTRVDFSKLKTLWSDLPHSARGALADSSGDGSCEEERWAERTGNLQAAAHHHRRGAAIRNLQQRARRCACPPGRPSRAGTGRHSAQGSERVPQLGLVPLPAVLHDSSVGRVRVGRHAQRPQVSSDSPGRAERDRVGGVGLAAGEAGCSIQQRSPPSKELLREADARVYRLLGIGASERLLIEDFLSRNLLLVKGKVAPEAVTPPSDRDVKSYLETLRARPRTTSAFGRPCIRSRGVTLPATDLGYASLARLARAAP